MTKSKGKGGLPWKYRILARIAGVNVDLLAKLWSWSDGKKTKIGAWVSTLSAIAGVLALWAGVDGSAAWLVTAAGAAQLVNGLAHKAYKARYGEEHVEPPTLKK